MKLFQRNFQESPLKSLVRDLLREDALETAPPQEGGDSLDSQIDRYLSDYESSSKTAKQEGHGFNALTRHFLREADENDAGDDQQADAPPAQPAKAGLDAIDMEEFSNDVARLIENYDNLLEVRSTLIRRSLNFISKNYDQSAVDSLEKLLREKHSLVDGESKQDVEDEMFQAPPADRAGPGGAGA